MAVDLAARPRFSDLRRLGGPPAVDLELTTHIEAADAELEAARRPRKTAASAFEGRAGYSETFLGDFVVPLPVPSRAAARDVLPIAGSENNRLDYTHFSIVMSKARRIAMYVGVNIDGKNRCRSNARPTVGP